MNKRILGIDPGSQVTGFGLIEQVHNQTCYLSSGCIKVRNLAWDKRLKQIHTHMESLIQEFKPTHCAIERVFVHKNVASALKLGQARGAAIVAVAAFDIPIESYSPRQIKKNITGYGGADKKQIQQMVKSLLALSDVPQADAADALAIALCHAHHSCYN